ncbi:hypothetical protein [Streptomyces parvulus]|uniref:hypothetical protein n=1 Tax=Streptomyces parvulus TaxID=146923 RepID=UPI0037F66AD3
MKATMRQIRSAFVARSRRTPSGHRCWKGSVSSTGTPMLFVGKERFTAARAGFLLAHGREPVGNVKPGCGRASCVEPDHLEDRPMRDARRAAERAQPDPIVDEMAVELAVAGRLRAPDLSPAEKAAAVALAPPSMPVITLARRIGACSRTVKKLREATPA